MALLKMKTKLKIIFSCLGFASTEAFVIKDNRQLMVGTLSDMTGRGFDYWPYDFCMEHYVKRNHYLTEAEVPTAEEVIAEYERQYKEKGVWLNPEIRYAG